MKEETILKIQISAIKRFHSRNPNLSESDAAMLWVSRYAAIFRKHSKNF